VQAWDTTPDIAAVAGSPGQGFGNVVTGGVSGGALPASSAHNNMQRTMLLTWIIFAGV
jgi:hypothetical protein